VVVVYFKLLFQYLPGGTEKSRKASVTTATSQAEIRTRYVPNIK